MVITASYCIQRAPYCLPTSLKDVGIDHCSAHILLPQQFLHRADVIAIFQEENQDLSYILEFFP